jgi:hypothetical protein
MTPTDQQKLNALIAEKVMGWKKGRTVFNLEYKKNYFMHCEEGPIVQRFEKSAEVYPFNPTTDPAQALEVLKKCLEKTCAEIHLLANGEFAVCWEDEKRCRTITKTAPTLQLAICLFAAELVKGVGE